MLNESLVTQFGAPDAPHCDPTTARVTIIPAPLEYSVCYMKGTQHGPQAILHASSKMYLSHATIERRVVDMGIPLTEIGIRSFSPEEAEFLKTSPNVAIVWGYQLAKGTAIIPWKRLTQHTYVTIDLDALDPSEMPAVGTPEPGGLHWYQLLDLFREICHRTTIVAMDVVELCPMPGQTRADFLAAKLVDKMIGYRFFAGR